MKESLLESLVCPHCRGDLKIAAAYLQRDEIESGTLECTECSQKYPIIRHIPRFLPEAHYKLFWKTWRNFGFSWRRFARIYSDPRDFLDWIKPVTPDFFRGKKVLDAGCGTGMHALFAARFGAKEVIAFDLSPAVEVAWQNSRSFPQIQVIQADIYHLPLKQSFDYVYSIGVLQHLPDPEQGFYYLVEKLKKDGWISIWVYGYEGTALVRYVVDPVRQLSSRLPLSLVYWLSFWPTFVFYVLSRGIFQPLSTPSERRIHKLLRKVPLSDYLAYMAQFNFTYMHNSIFDQLIAPITKYFRRWEIEAWFKKAGLKDVVITSRNEMSWRGFGRRAVASSLSGEKG